ncbi:MAG: tetratricopeptide repeat protein [Bacteroidota bacterium]
MIRTLLVGCIMAISVSNYSQRLLNDQVLIEKIEMGINYMYNCQFEKSGTIYKEVVNELPGHPAGVFLEGIQVYWKNFPITPHNFEKEQKFISAMEKTIQLSSEMLEKNEKDIEGCFFQLISRGMLMMYYADIGSQSKVIPHASPSYKHVLKAFDYIEKFPEFLFITGLYSYYIEAYPEYHPFYKPFVMLFKKGNKKEGLSQLKHACDHTIFVRAESLLFTSIIYMNFEKESSKALLYAEKLHNLYPRNPYFLSRYVEMLIENEKFQEAVPFLIKLFDYKDNKFVLMNAFVFKGAIEEKYKLDMVKAEKDYKQGLELTPLFGDRSPHYQSIAYAGLSRIHKKDNPKLSKSYWKMAKDAATYSYVLD